MKNQKSGALALIFGAFAVSLYSCSQETIPDRDDESTLFRSQFLAPPREAGALGSYKPIPDLDSPTDIGFAVDLENVRGMPNECMNGTTKTVTRQEGFVSLDSDMSKDELSALLGVSGGGDANFLHWGASAKAEFVRDLTEASTGINYIALAIFRDHSQVFIPTERKAMWAASHDKDWLASCGTGYVAAKDYGSMLMLRLNLKLEKGTSRAKWAGNAGGHFLSLSRLRASLQSNRAGNKTHGTLSISAYQLGGIPSELGSILRGKSEDGSIGGSISLCEISEAETCLKALANIENYIGESFPKQVMDRVQGGSAEIKSYQFVYPSSIGPLHAPQLDPLVVTARKILAEAYKAEFAKLETLGSLNASENMTGKKLASQLIKNLAEIRQATNLCFAESTYPECVDRAAQVSVVCNETKRSLASMISPNRTPQ